MLMRDVIDLNYDWKFKQNFTVEELSQSTNDGYESVDIPHSFPIIPYNYLGDNYYSNIAFYKKEFFFDKKYRGKIINIAFSGVAHVADVYLNGKHVGKHRGGYNRFVFNISKFINYGSLNILHVVVDSS